eukprot:gb/GECG01008153.1/.p1 GENE.gb/GECG01008153.1/~~gb/GECG01008153.1/.p1  ORF type:complete len:116 (+),score=9.13 gb/GECG01008153.1/:1-348(+)
MSELDPTTATSDFDTKSDDALKLLETRDVMVVDASELGRGEVAAEVGLTTSPRQLLTLALGHGRHLLPSPDGIFPSSHSLHDVSDSPATMPGGHGVQLRRAVSGTAPATQEIHFK